MKKITKRTRWEVVCGLLLFAVSFILSGPFWDSHKHPDERPAKMSDVVGTVMSGGQKLKIRCVAGIEHLYNGPGYGTYYSPHYLPDGSGKIFTCGDDYVSNDGYTTGQ